MEDIKQQNETKTKKRNALNGVWWPYQMFRQFVDAQQEFRFFKRISSFLGRVGGAFRASQHFRDRCLINDANQRYALVFLFRFNVKFRRSRTLVVWPRTAPLPFVNGTRSKHFTASPRVTEIKAIFCPLAREWSTTVLHIRIISS